MSIQAEPYPSGPELMVGAVYGYRWWRLGPSGELYSPWRGPYLWEQGRNEARCLLSKRFLGGWRVAKPGLFRSTEGTHTSQIPSRDCHCGFYGLWTIPLASAGSIPMLWEIDPSTSGASHGFVLGIVEGSGRLLIGTDGFRAASARPIAVATGASVPPPPSFEALRYRMGVQMYQSVAGLVSAWGNRVAEGLDLLDPDGPFGTSRAS
jgi:hypothetical protein